MVFLKTVGSITWILFVLNFTFSSAFFRLEEFYRQRWLEEHISKDDLSYGSSEDRYFVQRLDHFDPFNEKTWLQRYWVNSTFHKKGGPAFLLINGESQAAEKFNKYQWKKYAQKFNATFFSLEHRFYGRSVPNNDTSTQNLVYLKSQQALADIANFIGGVANQYNIPNDTKWIVLGCSYAGSLAAWVRLKYPHLVHGAVSSSAPLLAKENFLEYYKVVRESLDSISIKPNCSGKVAEANEELGRLIQSDEGRGQVKEQFRLCFQVDNNMESISTLFSGPLNLLAYAVQYGYKRDIESFCNIMTSSNASALELYAKAMRSQLEKKHTNCWNNRYSDGIKNLKSTNKVRQWTYQLCTEFGWYQTSNTRKSSDSTGAYIPVEYFIKKCEDIFGPKFNGLLLNRTVYETNNLYGGLKINVGNIVFTHGSIDPWHSIGITPAIPHAPNQTIIYIQGASHCEDISVPKNNTNPDVKKAQEEIANTLQSWLQN
ncbi:putative serine protease K12H4.7 isoform X2 [Planococcus citri]|uniref:putative serine protease K12H4.7 isoform X2 n=1 Tax=Planococcus citri TaxID=170843 RepID=UPI0031F84495